MVASVGSGILVNAGHLLENLVFTALRRVTPDIFYYKTKGGREVDFIAQMEDRSRLLIQVCESMANPQTRKREITALAEAMRELKMTCATIVTRTDNEQLEVESGIIDIVPAYRFLLNMPEKYNLLAD